MSLFFKKYEDFRAKSALSPLAMPDGYSAPYVYMRYNCQCGNDECHKFRKRLLDVNDFRAGLVRVTIDNFNKYEMADLNERQFWMFQCLKRLHGLKEAKRIIRVGEYFFIAHWHFPLAFLAANRHKNDEMRFLKNPPIKIPICLGILGGFTTHNDRVWEVENSKVFDDGYCSLPLLSMTDFGSKVMLKPSQSQRKRGRGDSNDVRSDEIEGDGDPNKDNHEESDEDDDENDSLLLWVVDAIELNYIMSSARAQKDKEKLLETQTLLEKERQYLDILWLTVIVNFVRSTTISTKIY